MCVVGHYLECTACIVQGIHIACRILISWFTFTIMGRNGVPLSYMFSGRVG
jgi:hypothetical protein